MKRGDLDGEPEKDVGHADPHLGKSEDRGDREPASAAGVATRQPGGGADRDDDCVADAAVEDVKPLDAGPGREELPVHAGRPIRAHQARVVRRNESTQDDLSAEESPGEGGHRSLGRISGTRGRFVRSEPSQTATQENDGEGEGISCHEMRRHGPGCKQLEDGQPAEYDLRGEEQGRREQTGSHALAQVGQSKCEDREHQKDQADAAGEYAMSPLEGDLEVELRDDFSEAERPIGA